MQRKFGINCRFHTVSNMFGQTSVQWGDWIMGRRVVKYRVPQQLLQGLSWVHRRQLATAWQNERNTNDNLREIQLTTDNMIEIQLIVITKRPQYTAASLRQWSKRGGWVQWKMLRIGATPSKGQCVFWELQSLYYSEEVKNPLWTISLARKEFVRIPWCDQTLHN